MSMITVSWLIVEAECRHETRKVHRLLDDKDGESTDSERFRKELSAYVVE